METHLSYPLLAFYRSQHVNQNWLAALVTVLDASAFAIAVAPERTPAAEITFAIGRHAIADLAYTFRAQPAEPAERLDGETFERLRTKLAEAGLQVADPDESRHKLGQLRALYEPFGEALSRRLQLALPSWIREARTENWREAAWRERRSPATLH
jgi:hypothetical protein